MSTAHKDPPRPTDKLISLKITYQDGFIARHCTYRVASQETAGTVLSMICKLRNVKMTEYKLVYDDHVLVSENTLFDNQLNSSSKLYHLSLVTNEEVIEKCFFPQRIVKKETIESEQQELQTATRQRRKATVNTLGVRLRIEEKVNQQIIGCDINAKTNMKFERIRVMYCQHRGYKPEDYMFAVDGVLIEPNQTLAQMGLSATDKTYIVNVYHRSIVNISH
jgi:hypothetical protein